MFEVSGITVWFWICAMAAGYAGAVALATIVYLKRKQ